MKLFEFLRHIVANATFNAVYQDKVSANARARGMQDLLATLHKLRVFPSEESQSLEDVPTELPVNIRGAVDGRRFGFGSGSAIGRNR